MKVIVPCYVMLFCIYILGASVTKRGRKARLLCIFSQGLAPFILSWKVTFYHPFHMHTITQKIMSIASPVCNHMPQRNVWEYHNCPDRANHTGVSHPIPVEWQLGRKDLDHWSFPCGCAISSHWVVWIISLKRKSQAIGYPCEKDLWYWELCQG